MKYTGERRGQRGLAMIIVVLLSLAVAVIGTAAVIIGSNASLIGRYSERQGVLEAAADDGMELVRSRVNGDPTLYPESLFNTLENGSVVTQAGGAAVPGVRRWTYIGPTGIISGQYGVFGSVVSVAEDQAGNRVVRRTEVVQESFAKYAYFTDIEPSNISFGGGDQLFGPVHTNDYLKIYSSGATFFGTVTTARTVQGAQYGTFAQGYTENAPYIPMPQTAQLTKLATQATAGRTNITGNTAAGYGQATTRLEFMAIDLNGDGDASDGDEGFMRVYHSNDPAWLMADVPGGGLITSRNCGHYHGTTFIDVTLHPNSGPDSKVASLSSSTKRCYLGGADSLYGAFTVATTDGQWLPWTGAVSPLLAGRADAQYLFPLSRALNPSFKGVIYVSGDVAISGVVRGQFTLAATGNIVIADDVVYATSPGAVACSPDKDILGLFAGGDVVVADNAMNAPVRPATGQNWFTYDDTKDEFVHAIVLTLNIFTVENYASGATTAEACGIGVFGRGCLYLTGGVIQRQRGAVGTIGNPGGTGYLKRYSYDNCAFEYPPPYFPTTGHFARGRYFDVDPANFNVAAYYRFLSGQ